ncbi:MAG: hypothetical protein P4L77_11875 [Sulfuriferula sp.]|nr:hypothetical protein [Sulfuriferula sp.]
MKYILVGRVAGAGDLYLATVGGPIATQPWWTPSPAAAHHFDTKKDAAGYVQWMQRCMYQHEGRDPVTGDELVKIDLPYWAYLLLKEMDEDFMVPDDEERLADIFVCEYRIEPTEVFISIKGKLPKPKENG